MNLLGEKVFWNVNRRFASKVGDGAVKIERELFEKYAYVTIRFWTSNSYVDVKFVSMPWHANCLVRGTWCKDHGCCYQILNGGEHDFYDKGVTDMVDGDLSTATTVEHFFTFDADAGSAEIIDLVVRTEPQVIWVE